MSKFASKQMDLSPYCQRSMKWKFLSNFFLCFFERFLQWNRIVRKRGEQGRRQDKEKRLHGFHVDSWPSEFFQDLGHLYVRNKGPPSAAD